MRALLAATLAVCALSGAVSARSFDATPGDPYPGSALSASAPCTDDLFCGNIPAADTTAFYADGEWDPVSGNCGWVSTSETVAFTSSICGWTNTCTLNGFPFNTNGTIPRSFAYGLSGDYWIGTWTGATDPESITHVSSSCQTIASFVIDDPDTPANYQISGLALDRANNHLWAITRNNPVGTISRFVEFDIASGTPVLIQGPFPVPWNGGPSAVSSAGLEYNNHDCTIVALRQDANNVGVTELTVFKDNNPALLGAPTFLAYCNIVNAPCTGVGSGSNRPWGIALVEDPNLGDYVIYNDLNLDAGCVAQAIGPPIDLHIATLPSYQNSCDVVAVEPTTWGKIKNDYAR
jgi:hypothetical protein